MTELERRRYCCCCFFVIVVDFVVVVVDARLLAVVLLVGVPCTAKVNTCRWSRCFLVDGRVCFLG